MAMPIPPSSVSKKNQAMTIFIVVTMVASTLGFALWYGQDDNQQPAPELPAIDSPTIITYEGEASGAVVELFSRVLVIAPTEQAEIGKIDAELYSIEGVRRVTSTYLPTSQDTQFGLKLNYRAEVDLDKGKAPSDFVRELTESSEYLYGISAWRTGLVSIPKEVSLTSPDLNLTKEHTFDDPLIQVYLSTETRKEDLVSVYMGVGLAGNTIQSLIAEETRNITAAPHSLYLEREMGIAELEPRLVFSGSFGYSNAYSEELLEREIAALGGVEAAQATIGEPWYYSLDIDLGGEFDENAVRETLSGIEGITSVSAGSGPTSLYADFNSAYSPAELKEAIVSALPGYSLGITEPESSVLLDINYSANALAKSSKELSALLEKLGIEGETYQPAKIAAETIEGDDGNSFSVPDGMFQAYVLPAHNEGDSVSLDITVYAARGKIVSVQAAETRPETE